MLSVLLDVSAIFNNVVAPPTCVANLGCSISSFVLLFGFILFRCLLNRFY
jgi:hypothetical protein